MRKLTLAPLLLLTGMGMAYGAHGHAGLWNITTTMDMSQMMPPEAMAQMKAMGMAMPGSRPMTSQICMTQADVEADRPPPSTDRESGCTTRLTSQTATGMRAQMTCNGRMKGTGNMQVAYSGTDHYSGSFDFQGTVEGNPAKMSSTFRGDWVKADCGAVRPVPRSP